jgi:ribonuclease Z
MASLTIQGTSIAGIETCVEVPSLKLALDMGRCTANAVGLPIVLISHGHLDHCGALPQHAARRAMMGMSPGTYVVPAGVAADVQRLFEAAEALDQNPIPRTIVPLAPGETFALSKTRFVRPFETFHRVVSQGYAVWEKRSRLKPEFDGRSGEELARRRQSGVELTVTVEVPLLAFTGDTRVEVLERTEEIHLAETLIMEVSFLDERVSVADARSMGHIHLDEVLARESLLQNAQLVFCHFSARYSPEQVRTILEARLPESFRARVEPLLAQLAHFARDGT